jgi:hypothetical protein
VLSELLRRNYIAALAPTGVPNADIVVSDMAGTRLCSMQVKTRRGVGADCGWHMKAKHEQLRGDRLFHCFVDFLRVFSIAASVKLRPDDFMLVPFRAPADEATRGSRFSSRSASGRLMMG